MTAIKTYHSFTLAEAFLNHINTLAILYFCDKIENSFFSLSLV